MRRINSRRGRLFTVLRSRLLDLLRNLACEAFGRHHPREGAEAQNPAMKSAVDADVKRDADTAAWQIRYVLRRMPLPRTHVVRDGGLKVDLNPLRRPRMNAERMGEGSLRQLPVINVRRKAFLEQRDI